MKIHLIGMAAVLALTLASPSRAQVPVTASADHEAMLHSKDAALAVNKRLVYDFWREVLEAGQTQLADRYLSDDYIQHNPNVPTGRAGFVSFLASIRKPQVIEARVAAPLVSIVAEGDLVVLSFVRNVAPAKGDSAGYTTTWFDMFRIEAGKIAEHWDPATKP